MFKEHETCETPGQCEELKMCYRALVIEVEAKYEDEKPGESSLEYAITEAKCQHSEAKEEIKEAQVLLSKPTD